MSPRAVRAGYTLVELLVVIAIIAVLASLLLVGISAAREKARELQARADLSSLDTALVNFKAKNNNNSVPCVGGGPNGTFRLCSTYVDASGNSLMDTTPSGPREWPEIGILLRFFPRMSLTDNGLRLTDMNGDPTPVHPDANSDGRSDNLQNAGIGALSTLSAPLLLDPNQLAVFFLTGAHFTAYSGFATNQTQPFASGFGNPPTVPLSGNTNRLNGGSYLELKQGSQLKDPTEVLDELYPPPPMVPNRDRRWQGNATSPVMQNNIVDSLTSHLANALYPTAPASNQKPGRVKWFVDPWGTPYLYLSALNGNNDYPFSSFNASGTVPPWDIGGLKMFPWGGEYTPAHNYAPAVSSNRAFDGFFPFRDGSTKFSKDKTFQLLSAGKDGQYLNKGPDLAKDPSGMFPQRGFGPGSRPFCTEFNPGEMGVAAFNPLLPKFQEFKPGERTGYLDTEPGADDLSNTHGFKLGTRNN